MEKKLYTKNMVYGMTYRGDCVSTGKAVILHSEINTSKTTASPPALSRREGAGRQQRNINENEQNYGQYKANANARILLLPGYDDGNEVRDCW